MGLRRTTGRAFVVAACLCWAGCHDGAEGDGRGGAGAQAPHDAQAESNPQQARSAGVGGAAPAPGPDARDAKGALEEAGVDAVGGDGLTPLHVVVSAWSWEPWNRENTAYRVGRLLDAGANVNVQANDGATPLHYAAEKGAWEVARILIAAGARVDIASATGDTPLHAAAAAGEVDQAVVERMLEAGADPNAVNAAGHTPLSLAAKGDGLYLAVVRRLLSHGASPNLPDGARSPLAEAARQLRGALAAMLIDHGADTTSITCETCLRALERHQQYEVLARLLPTELFGTGAPPSELDGWLRGAIDADSPDKVRRLLELGARIDDPSLYELMVEEDAASVMSSLLEHGELEAGDIRSEWLDTAARFDSARVARLLIERGADVGARDGADWTPMHSAVLRWHYIASRPLSVARMLIEAGAPVDVPTAASGWTPLHLAADINEPEIMEMLLAAGADVNARTNLGGWTPLHVAEKRGEDALEAIDVLRAAGGVTMRNEGVAYLPVFGGGRDFGRDLLEEAMAYDGIHEALFAMPILGRSGGGREVRGSFTARGVEERLVFEEIGVGESLVNALLVALVDHRGESRLVFATDHYIEFQGICFDAPTGTHAAIFERSFDGSCCPWSETVYMQFDADAATLAEVYVDRRPTDEEAPSDHGQADTSAGACRWRDTVSAERLYFGHLGALMVGGREADIGDSAYKTEDGAPVSLPTRVIPTETVESSLAAIEALPGVGNVGRNDLGGSPRWKTVTVSDGRGEDYDWGGAALVWDEVRSEWRSFYDRHYIDMLGLNGNALVVRAVSSSCGTFRLGHFCYLKIDLDTFEAQRIRPNTAADFANIKRLDQW